MAKILIVNGSLGGSTGNTAQAIQVLQKQFTTQSATQTKSPKLKLEIQILHLCDMLSELFPLTSVSASAGPNFLVKSHGIDLRGLRDSWLQSLAWADGFVFTTGTYWDSWGSPLQIFLENLTPSEGSAHWLGKPALCLVTMHSVGGKGVLSRLQSVLTSFGAMIPPMSGMAYSMTGHEMLRSQTRDESFDHDIWSLDDLQIMSENFLCMLRARIAGHLNFQAWQVDHQDPARLWLTEASPVGAK